MLPRLKHAQLGFGVLTRILFFATSWCLTGLTPASGQRVELAQPGNEPVDVESAEIHSEVTGSIAVTTFDLVFKNPNARVLEGTLIFPLLDGQEVTRFALDIDGHLRDAVPVEKNRGQAVFEQIERQGADPALLEKAAGNDYRARLYPIPAHGTRRVRLSYQESLPSGSDPSVYRLALDFPQRLQHFSVHLKVHTGATASPEVHTTLDLTLPPWQDEQVMEIERADFIAHGILEVALPKSERPKVITGRYQNTEYFYAEIPTSPILFNRPAPKVVGILWDSSSSGSDRDHSKELALLDAWFAELKDVEVRLVRFRNHVDAAKTFDVSGGDWHLLRAEIEATDYDGATSLDGLVDDPKVDSWVLFSDGIFNYGVRDTSAKLPLHGVVHTITANAHADTHWLRAVAAERDGEFIDLLRSDSTKAAFALQTRSQHLLSIDFDPSAVSQIFPEPGAPVPGDSLILTGILKKKNATVRLVVGQDHNNAQNIEVPLISGDDPSELVPRAWALDKISLLSIDARNNRESLRATSQQFGIVTADTSLIVLETLDDYVRFEIAPPDDLRAEWESRRQAAAADVRKNHLQHLDDVLAKFHERIKWWEQNFPQDNPPLSVATRNVEPVLASQTLAVVAGAPREGESLLEPFEVATGQGPAPTLAGTRAKSAVFDASAGGPSAPAGNSNDPIRPAEIHLIAASPNTEYIEHYRRIEKEHRYRAYLEERAEHRREPAFFLGSADFFFEEGASEIALQILSNLAELDTDDPALLRVLGHRLLQADRADLAAPLFERVLLLRPEEPQSRRDLAMAEVGLKKFQKAIDLLWEIADQSWDARFPEIEIIALSELNAIVATCGQKLDTSRIDSRLKKNLPLDLRVVLTWDADGTDIDLWVVDPNQQTAKYDFPLTYQGGHMSRDFTGGYGPEEFDLRRAKSGKYALKINYFGDRRQTVLGPVTAQIKVITGFGTAAQKEKRLTVRLKDKQETLDLGDVQMGLIRKSK